MSTIQAAERATYDHMWAAVPDYSVHAPGEQFLPLFLDMAKPDPGDRVLDAGCGSGKGAVALAKTGLTVRMCDLSDAGLTREAKILPFERACLWENLYSIVGPHDYVYCTDVLEHIPTQFTMLAIHQMMRVGALFLTVSLVPDAFGVWAGKPLHQTVESFLWWRDNLREVGTSIEARDLVTSAAFFVEAK